MTETKTIIGKVRYVKFFNEVNGYTIMEVKPNNGKSITVVTSLSSKPLSNTKFKMDGVYTINSKYGEQFNASSCVEILPDDTVGIEAYLSSKLFKGIGPATAKKIVNKFGKNTLEVIDKTPEKLSEIKGISKKSIESLKESWVKNKEYQDVMIFLKKYGITNHMAMKIYKKYGSDTVDFINRNPYRLINDIDGIGFLTCDKIALSMGYAYDSNERICATITYIFELMAMDGHTYQSPTNLKSEVLKYLNNSNVDSESYVKEDKIDECINILVSQRNIIEDNSNEDEIKLSLFKYYWAEQNVADKLTELNNYYKNSKSKAKINIKEIEKQVNITYNDKQKEAIKTALNNNVMVLTGGPGTGKTTTTNGIIKALQKQNLKITCAAPTGKAADRMSEVTGLEAYTIHRLIGCKPAETDNEELKASKRITSDVLIVDESSMINILLMNALLEMVPSYVKLILIGDIDQLPAIGPGNVLSDIIKSNNIPVIKLTEIYRQAKESKIITTAHNIINNEPVEVANTKDNDMFFIENYYNDGVIRNVVDLIKNRLPKKYGLKPTDIQVLIPMRVGDVGSININTILQSELNKSTVAIRIGDNLFKVNDKVMQIKNNYDKDIYNGDTGIITDINPEDEIITIKFKDKVLEYEPYEMDQIQLAYAITIHKSQGSEYPICIIPITMGHYKMLNRNLIYTAITRCKNMCIIVGDKKAFTIATKTLDSHHRKTNLMTYLNIKNENVV